MNQPSNLAKSIFLDAVELRDDHERNAFIAEQCAENVDLRQEVNRLLGNYGKLGSFMESSAKETPTLDQPSLEKPGSQIGPYKLLQEIGQGGMGVVYMAEQKEPVERRVALKIIKPGMDSQQVIARFAAERQALSLMDHPNIAKVLDAGTTDSGRPYFVMELVNGIPVTQFCDEQHLTARERLELFIPICQAVQHAHQKGIIHRDLKPSNIMVALYDGHPVAKVIDFGVAKAVSQHLTEQTMFTGLGQIVGTIEYMSPEQAQRNQLDIDTRSDIYSLGVVLYELLTGATPFDKVRLCSAALDELLRIIREEEPPRPSTRLSGSDTLPSIAASRRTEPARLSAALRRELDWIVMKSLEKERATRYQTALAFSADIERYLNDEIVEARPPTRGYRLRKFMRRRRGPVIAGALLLLTLIGGLAGTSIGLHEARRQAAHARNETAEKENARRAEEQQRKLAVAEKTKAENSAELAQQQRTRAEEREQQAINAVKRFRDAVADNPELKNNPSLDALRKTLLKEPLTFFQDLRDRLQSDHDTRPESLARLAKATFELANLTYHIGDKGDALRTYREVLAIQQQLVHGNPLATVYAQDLASTYNNLAVLSIDTGHSDKAREAFEQAREIQERMVREHPIVTAYAQDLASTSNNVGLLFHETGDPDEARKAYEQAREIHERLVREHPTVTGYAKGLATTYNNLGNLFRDIGDRDEARKTFEQARSIHERLVREDPTNTGYAQDLATTYGNLGVLYFRDIGHRDEAHKAYEQAREILERLVRENPTVTDYARNLAKTYDNVGDLFGETGHPEEARKAYEQAQEIKKRLVRENSLVTGYAQDLAGTYGNLGNLFRHIGHPDEARTAYEQAREILERLARQHPTIPAHANGLGKDLHILAGIEFAAQRFSAARDRVQEAIDWQKKALALSPQNSEYRQRLKRHYSLLTQAAQQLDDVALIAEAQQAIAELDASDPVLLALDQRLEAMLQGEAPKDNPERLALAQRAYDTKQFALAARLWAEATVAQPELAEDRQARHRYNAACAAALAASETGQNPAELNEKSQLKLRNEAYDWLLAAFETWSKFLETSTPPQRAAIGQILEHWKQDSDLLSVRDPAALASIPEGEREKWKSLWARVDELLAKGAN